MAVLIFQRRPNRRAEGEIVSMANAAICHISYNGVNFTILWTYKGTG